jgi:hypothetical protein
MISSRSFTLIKFRHCVKVLKKEPKALQVAATAAPQANQAVSRTTPGVVAAAMRANAVAAAVLPVQKVVHPRVRKVVRPRVRKVHPGLEAVLQPRVEKASPRVVPQPAGKADRGASRRAAKRAGPQVALPVVLQSPLGRGLPVAREAAVLSRGSHEQAPVLHPDAPGAEAQRAITRESRKSRKLGMEAINIT